MSKLSTLKEQNPNMNIGVIDALSILFEKTKYVELTLNLHKQNFHKRIHKDHIKSSYTNTLVDMGFKEEFVKQLPLPTLVLFGMPHLVDIIIFSLSNDFA